MENEMILKAGEISPLDTNEGVQAYVDRLLLLRKDGSRKIAALKEELYNVKHTKIIDEAHKNKIIAENKTQMKEAKANQKEKREEIKSLVHESKEYIKNLSFPYEKEKREEGKKLIKLDKPIHEAKIKELKKNYCEKREEQKLKNLAKIQSFKKERSLKAKEATSIEKIQYKKDFAALKRENQDDLSSLKIAFLSSIKDEKNRRDGVIKRSKEMSLMAYQSRFNKISTVKEGRLSLQERIEHRFKMYSHSFSLKETLINNALYIAVALFFIGCFILSPLLGQGNILTWSNISGYLENTSANIFFTLGVAGLIVLGGTDLSIGRLIGLGSVCVGFLLHKGAVPATLFSHIINLDGIPSNIRVVFALLLSITATTLFAAIAGFFTAKFKIHAFITTLSTMMIVYGLGYVATSGIPTGQPDVDGIDDIILGRIGGSDGFPKYIIYGVIAIAIVWFIWNKTRFGKNMFAVGGNSEAATVSGISCFKVTFCVFIMAGILYGFGSFFFAFSSNPAVNAGYGYELDAIAACVVGGVSFLGGIGKIKGAVIGCCIFSGLSYVLSLMSVSSYWQFFIKGIILLAAVSLDSLRFAKKK